MHDVLGQEITPGCVVAHATMLSASHAVKIHVCIVREIIEGEGIRADQLLVRTPRAEGDVVQNILLHTWLKKSEHLLVTKITEQELREKYNPFFMSWKEWRGY